MTWLWIYVLCLYIARCKYPKTTRFFPFQGCSQEVEQEGSRRLKTKNPCSTQAPLPRLPKWASVSLAGCLFFFFFFSRPIEIGARRKSQVGSFRGWSSELLKVWKLLKKAKVVRPRSQPIGFFFPLQMNLVHKQPPFDKNLVPVGSILICGASGVTNLCSDQEPFHIDESIFAESSAPASAGSATSPSPRRSGFPRFPRRNNRNASQGCVLFTPLKGKLVLAKKERCWFDWADWGNHRTLCSRHP